MAFLDYCYTLKRFTYSGNVINEDVFKRICPALNLDYDQVIAEGSVTPQWLNWRNKHVYDQGTWELETLLSLGFLLCAHPSREDQQEEFWQLLNPELNDTVDVERVLAFLTIFVKLSIDMRFTIEVLSGHPDQSILDYLKLVDMNLPRDDLAANLLGFPSATELRQQVRELNRDSLFELVLFENTMSTLGIRLRLLDSRQDTHHTLIEEGLGDGEDI